MNIHEDDHDDKVDPILLQASKLNSDLGRFVRTCSFSSHLTGRFYQNNSMETQTAREQRIARMNAKRKKLERDVKVEDAKIRYLEKLLHLKEEKQRASAIFQAKANTAARRIQSFARSCLAKNQLELLRVERNIMIYVALFLQSLYRGIKDRRMVQRIKTEYLRYIQESSAAVKLQKRARCFLAKRRLCNARQERDELVHSAATKVQVLARASICRIAFRREQQNRLEYISATILQSFVRSYHARRIVEGLKRERGKKKPEKVSSLLCDRRYSTYSIKAIIPRKPRRQSAGSVTAKDEDIHTQTTRHALPLPVSNKNVKKRYLINNKIDTNRSHLKQFKGSEERHIGPYDQVVTPAQQKQSQQEAELGRLAKQEKNQQHVKAKKAHEKSIQLGRNRKVPVPSSAPTKTKRVQLGEALASSESVGSDVKIETTESDDNYEFEALIPENENDID